MVQTLAAMSKDEVQSPLSIAPHVACHGLHVACHGPPVACPRTEVNHTSPLPPSILSLSLSLSLSHTHTHTQVMALVADRDKWARVKDVLQVVECVPSNVKCVLSNVKCVL